MGYHNDNGEFVSQNYADLDKNSIPDQIAIAHQDLKPSSFISVEEYIKLGNPHADPEKVQAVKDLLHIDTKGENGAIDCTKMLDHNFSGGQQKRIELARALIQDSPIMILDEPTSGVDETMTKDIVAYLKELGKEKTIVYITHDAREISAIGATRAIDIDKFWSKDHSQNTAAHIDLTAPGAMEQYTKFFTNRSVHEKEEEKKKEQEEKLNNIKENKETHRAVQTELQSARNLLNNKNTPPSQQPKEPETSLVSKAKENTVSLGKVPNGVVGRS
jgi:ABC-type multidrug transport system ATPase subunit